MTLDNGRRLAFRLTPGEVVAPDVDGTIARTVDVLRRLPGLHP